MAAILRVVQLAWEMPLPPRELEFEHFAAMTLPAMTVRKVLLLEPAWDLNCKARAVAVEVGTEGVLEALVGPQRARKVIRILKKKKLHVEFVPRFV